jgi:chitinase
MAYKRFLVAAALGFVLAAMVQATEVMRRPDNYKSAPNVFPMAEKVTPHVIHKRATARTNAAYFTNW